MIRKDYYIAGMDCAEEVGALEKELAKLPGIDSTAFDVLQSRMSVHFDDDKTSEHAIKEAVAKAGLRADPWSKEHKEKRSDKGRVVAMLLSGALLLTALIFHVIIYGWRSALGQDEHGAVAWWIIVLYIVSAVAGAWFVIPRAINSAKALRPDINLLMTIAVAGALAIGEWFEAASVAFLFALSLALERWSVGRAQRAVEALMTLTPPDAKVKDPDGTERTVAVEDVKAGELVVVLPGERLPLDGTVRNGSSWVNQAPVTGESVPVGREPGNDVFAGTINGDGVLEIEVSHVASESLLAKVARLVEEARLKRSGHEQWVDKFARIYTPIVMILAVGFLLIPPLIFGQTWSASFYNALVLLVIACPCALVISTPVSIVAALAAGAKEGVLIKGGVHVESPASLAVVALDKTGTITKGELKVSNVTPMAGHDERELLEIAVALEHRSTHPLALAILNYAAELSISAQPADNLQNLPGKGAEGLVFGKSHWVGSHKFLEERGQETPEVHEQLMSLAKEGATVVVVGSESHVCGFFSLSDEVHPEASEVVAELKSLGIERVIMMTGDNRPTGEAIARAAGIDEVHAELLPEDKSALIRQLVSSTGKSVAMVGDGVNDAPAMAGATLGIAMGGKGTDVAIETSDIVLMTDNLKKLPWLVRHARRTVAIIRQNIFMSLASKALFMVLAAMGVATLWMAIMADMGVSLLAVFNALRILKTSQNSKEENLQ